MQSRLTSLAILYEKIYDSSDFRNINLNEFITNQDNQYKTLLSLNDIQFISKIDETLNLSIEVITPLSLLINELTMNSIKHAFPDKTMSDKKIVKKIARIDEDTARLTIMDNGVGIGKVDEIIDNLGCQIIKNLTRQLDGKIRLLDLDNGTGYELIFPITMDHTIIQ